MHLILRGSGVSVKENLVSAGFTPRSLKSMAKQCRSLGKEIEHLNAAHPGPIYFAEGASDAEGISAVSQIVNSRPGHLYTYALMIELIPANDQPGYNFKTWGKHSLPAMFYRY